MNRPIQFCPNTKSKTCIYNECPAFKTPDPSLWKCEVCNEVHRNGSRCSDTSHNRVITYIKDFYSCSKYNYKRVRENFGKMMNIILQEYSKLVNGY